MHFNKLGSAQWSTVLVGAGTHQQQVFNDFSLEIVVSVIFPTTYAEMPAQVYR